MTDNRQNVRGDHAQAIAVQGEGGGDPYAQGALWDGLGYSHHHLGQHHEAIARYRRAIDLLQQAGERHGAAGGALDVLGDAHLTVGDPAAAGEEWRRAVDVSR